MPNAECGHDADYQHKDGITGCLICRWQEAEKAAEENKLCRQILELATKEWTERNVPVFQ
jgi:hypothetical protein